MFQGRDSLSAVRKEINIGNWCNDTVLSQHKGETPMVQYSQINVRDKWIWGINSIFLFRSQIQLSWIHAKQFWLLILSTSWTETILYPESGSFCSKICPFTLAEKQTVPVGFRLFDLLFTLWNGINRLLPVHWEWWRYSQSALKAWKEWW